MQAIVWSIRSVMETVFKWVLLAQRALIREMEFQADRVAVAVAGSDAIVHALYRLQPADEDWDATVRFLNQELRKGFGVRDPYQIHRRIGQHHQKQSSSKRTSKACYRWNGGFSFKHGCCSPRIKATRAYNAQLGRCCSVKNGRIWVTSLHRRLRG